MLPFVKLACANTDLLLLDSVERGRSGAEMALALCRGRGSLGADGLLLVEETRGEGPAFRLSHYGADGVRRFALEAIQGAAAWLVSTGRCVAGEEVWFRTDEGDVRTRPSVDRAAVAVARPRAVEPRTLSLPGGLCVHGTQVELDQTQFVVALEAAGDLESLDLAEWGAELGQEGASFPAGARVSFVAPDGPFWGIRSYEPAGDDPTLAGGVAVVAAGWALLESCTPLLMPAAGEEQPGACRAAPATLPQVRLRFRLGDDEIQEVVFPEGSASECAWTTGQVRFVARGLVY